MKVKVEVDLNEESIKTLDSNEPVILNAGTPQSVVLYPVQPEKPKLQLKITEAVNDFFTLRAYENGKHTQTILCYKVSCENE